MNYTVSTYKNSSKARAICACLVEGGTECTAGEVMRDSNLDSPQLPRNGSIPEDEAAHPALLTLDAAIVHRESALSIYRVSPHSGIALENVPTSAVVGQLSTMVSFASRRFSYCCLAGAAIFTIPQHGAG